MVFDQGYGGTSGSAFGGRLAYTIEPQREILLDQGATPYAIDNSATVSAQVVRRIAYQLASGGSPSSVSKYQGVHTGTPFLGPLVSASGTPELQTSQTTFLSNGRAASRLNTLNVGGHLGLSCQHPIVANGPNLLVRTPTVLKSPSWRPSP